MSKSLTPKERAFINAYVGECHGNGTQSARLAGYKGSDKALGVQGVRLLAKSRVQSALQAIQSSQERKAILTAEELDAICSDIATQPLSYDRMRAITELNRVKGRHTVHVQHSGAVTLDHILSLSRGDGSR